MAQRIQGSVAWVTEMTELSLTVIENCERYEIPSVGIKMCGHIERKDQDTARSA